MERFNQGGASSDPGSDFAAALAWWREAGVDCAFTDEPTQWIAAEAEAPAPLATGKSVTPRPVFKPERAPEPDRPRLGGEPDNWPDALAEFTAWWLSEPSLDYGRVADRVPPRGVAQPRLMILVEQPEPQDHGALLSGAQGKMLDAILAAMGIALEETYLASALVRHTPMPDWAALNADGMAQVLAHHIKLVSPQRLICFGSNILSLTGHDPAQNTASLQFFNQDGETIPLLGSLGLDALVRARAKAGFWQRWLDWTGTTVS